MESRAKVLGHAAHPMLIVFPLGLLITALIFDIIYMVTDNPTFASVAFWNIAGGIIGGLIAAIAGLIDYLAIPTGTRAKSVGLWHGLGNMAMLGLFAVSWFMRLGANDYVPGTFAFILALAAVGLSAVTGWLGGELVERLGVGVDEGANLNAPNSLSGRPATETAAAGGPQRAEPALRERERGR